MSAGSVRSWIAVATLLGASTPLVFAQDKAAHWVGTWATAPFEQANVPRTFPLRPPATPASGAAPGAAPVAGAPAEVAGTSGATPAPAPVATVPGTPGSTGAAAGAPGSTAPATATAPAAATALPAGPPPGFRFPPPPIYGSSDMTLREIVHVSIGGSRERVIFTNEFGTTALRIESARAALSKDGKTVGASAKVTFGGRDYAIIPAGGMMVSDPIEMKLPALSDLAVTFFVPQQKIDTLSQHQAADQTNYVVDGNVADSGVFDGAKEIRSWVFLKGVEVEAPAHTAAIVTFGDSITDGAFASIDKNARWPDVLARRLQADKKTADLAVLNEGIGGNGVLRHIVGPSALSRFDRDVLGQSGVKYLVVLEAINDIGAYGPRNPNAPPPVTPPSAPPTAEDLIVGYKQLIERAHTHGIKVYMATLTPYGGAGYSSAAGEAVRTAVNQWIRSQKEADGVIDFDKLTLDPSNPTVFLPAYDHGDHLHPNDAGYKAMGDGVDLSLFTK